MRRRWRWPLVWRSTYDQAMLERNALRDLLADTNKTLGKHRTLLAGIKAQVPDTVRKLEKVLAG